MKSSSGSLNPKPYNPENHVQAELRRRLERYDRTC